ncbi:MAG: Gldg family protein [Clostridia bacterium]|nr:Gldg family protein [Clostridia bacterium]
MKFSLFKGKSKRTATFTLITLFSIVFLLVGNILLAYFTPIKSIYFDMTSENLYSLSDAMKEETAFIDELPSAPDDSRIKIIFCAKPDVLTSSTETRITYFMALKLQQRYSNIEVVCEDVSLNPTAFAQFKSNSLSEISASDIIVTYGDRYRISTASRFWMFDEGEYFSYNGEYHMVAMLKSVTAVEKPKAYFLTGHGETVYDPANPESPMSVSMQSFANLLYERGLEIATLDLKNPQTPDIPKDCVLLIINDPRFDFSTDPTQYDNFSYFSDIDRLDKYLVNRQGAVMVAKDYRINLPVLEDFLSEWGIEFGDSLVKDEGASLEDELNSNTQLIAEYNKNEENYSYAIYGDFASVSSAPRTIFKDAGYVKCTYKESYAVAEQGTMNTMRSYCDFLYTSPTAKPYAKNSLTGEYQDLAGYAGKYDLAALVIRNKLHVTDKTNQMSYLFCTNTKDFFSNDVIGNSYYANYDVVSSLIENISRLDIYGSNKLGGESLNSPTYGGKQIHSSVLSEELVKIYSPDAKEVIETNNPITNGIKAFVTVIVFALPLAVLVLGVVVKVRRKFL